MRYSWTRASVRLSVQEYCSRCRRRACIVISQVARSNGSGSSANGLSWSSDLQGPTGQRCRPTAATECSRRCAISAVGRLGNLCLIAGVQDWRRSIVWRRDRIWRRRCWRPRPQHVHATNLRRSSPTVLRSTLDSSDVFVSFIFGALATRREPDVKFRLLHVGKF